MSCTPKPERWLNPEKLKQWEEEQAIWLDMVAREEAEKRAAASPQPDDGSTEPKPAEGSANMPDNGTDDDKALPDVVIGNRPRSRSQSVESRGIRSRANPAMVAKGIIPEKGKPEEGSGKKQKKEKQKA